VAPELPRLADKPDRTTAMRTIPGAADFDLVMGHIRRFAGNDDLPGTTIHWRVPKRAIGAVKIGD